MASRRVHQVLSHLTSEADKNNSQTGLSYVQGPTEPALWDLSMGQMLEQQASDYPDRDAIVISWTGVRLTFRQMNDRSKIIARGLLGLGVTSQVKIGIFSGNCERYVELFFAVCRIGAVFVVLNPAYTPTECENALRHAGCSIIFTALDVGRKSQLPLLTKLRDVVTRGSPSLPELRKVIVLRGENPFSSVFSDYEDLVREAWTIPSKTVEDLTNTVDLHELCNFQFTSGTTGEPKAASLTHHNVINNGLFIGHTMRLRKGTDVICCPPPLYHAFGLVLGLLACYTHGVSIVFPSWSFDPAETIRAVVDEHCTGLLGVPTMLVASLQQYRKDQKSLGPVKLRTGIAAGSPVHRHLMEQLRATFGMDEMVIIYGMTELAGASFITSADDAVEDKLASVGRVIPHTIAKVIDPDGKLVPFGVRGELCMAGFGVQKGYYQNPAKTYELMKMDSDGVLWVHSGDEATLDPRGYCKITGRIKDMIIRGGENIYPFEIEQRLNQHPAVSQSSVVGLRDKHYGEIVAAFLEQVPETVKPDDEDLREWVRIKLGRYNAPVHIFWVGAGERVEDFPKTSSGKIKKVDLRILGNNFIEMT